MKDIHSILNAITNTTQAKVLTTIINVEGSAYRKEGTAMLFFGDDSELGLLSGGCLENDLKERAKQLMVKKSSYITKYDMMSIDELSWGQQSGCNGKITILLEYVNEQLQIHLKEVERFLKKGLTVLHVKKISEQDAVSEYFTMAEEKHIFGTSNNANKLPLNKWLSEQKNKLVNLDDSSEKYFIQVFKPKPRLVILGAGPDVRPLVYFAAKVGYSVIINDWRPAYCNNEFFPDADQLIIDFPKEFINKFTFSSTDSVVIMTHNFHKDKEILEMILQRKLQYVGILGPSKRTALLCTNHEIPESLHSPIGIEIGAEGPEEIAISIVAEIIKTERNQGPL